MSKCPICVIKVGGSLLSLANLPERLRSWLDHARSDHPNFHFVLIVGGGKFVEAVRRLHTRQALDEAEAHWICVDLMDINTRLVATMLPEMIAIEDFKKLLTRADRPGITLFCTSNFLQKVEPQCAGTRLPASWDVTSDSIAARLAVALGADSFVLLKSIPPPKSWSVEEDLLQLAEHGYVDRYLINLKNELPPLHLLTLSEPFQAGST